MKLNLGHRSDRYRAETTEDRERAQARSRNASNANRRRQHKSRRLHAKDDAPQVCKTFDLLTPDQAGELIANSKPVPAKDLAKLAGKLGTVIVVVDDQED